MNKHTPGQWEIQWAMAQGGEGNLIVDDRDGGESSIIAVVHFHDDVEGETKANTRLIGAAPKLLIALKQVYRDLQRYAPNSFGSEMARQVFAEVDGKVEKQNG